VGGIRASEYVGVLLIEALKLEEEGPKLGNVLGKPVLELGEVFAASHVVDEVVIAQFGAHNGLGIGEGKQAEEGGKEEGETVHGTHG